MIHPVIDPIRRERMLLATAVLVVVTGYFLTLTAFHDKPDTVTLSIGAFSHTFHRFLWDRLLIMVFVAAVYLTYAGLNRKRRHDFIVYPVIVCLTGLGLILLLRLSYDAHRLRHSDTISALAYRQMVWILAGLLLFNLTVRLTTYRVIHLLNRYRYTYVILALALVAATLVFGDAASDRKLSIQITKNLSIMPIEAVKILMILFAASFFCRRGSVDPHGSSRRNAFPYLVMIVLLLSLLVLQKDTGPLIIMWGVLAAMYGAATGRWFRVAVAGVATAGLAGVAYKLNTPSIVRTRFDMWLNPFSLNEQVVRGFWAQAAGGVFGTGSGHGTSFRIPEVQSDFNFVMIAEEFGFIGASMTIILFSILSLAGLNIALRSADPFRRILAVGIASMFFFQMLVIVAGNTGILPLTGITLPFISAGGSSLLSCFFLAGLLYRISCADRERMR
jgi:cell division protein FtsW (lipid II flippase)